MTSHPVYPKLDPFGRARHVLAADRPRLFAGRGWVPRASIVSDDLEMGAVTESCPIGEATVRAAGAGHDLLLVCHTEAAQRAAATALADAYRSGDVATARTRGVSRTRANSPPAPHASAPRADRRRRSLMVTPLARAIAARAVTVVSAGRPGLKHALNGRVARRLSALLRAGRTDHHRGGTHRRAGLDHRRLRAARDHAPIVLVGIEPSREEIEKAAEASGGRRRDRAVPLRRTPVSDESGAAGRSPGARAQPRGRAPARPLRRCAAPRPRRSGSPPTDSGGASWRRSLARLGGVFRSAAAPGGEQTERGSRSFRRCR